MYAVAQAARLVARPIGEAAFLGPSYEFSWLQVAVIAHRYGVYQIGLV